MAHKKESHLARRQFLQGLVAAPFIIGAGAEPAEPDPIPGNESDTESDTDSTTAPPSRKKRRVPALQTWADENSALVVVLGKPDWSFKCDASSRAHVKIEKAQKIIGAECVLYRLRVEGLSTTSYVSLQIFNAQNQRIDVRQLKGLDLEIKDPKIAVMSCSNFRKLRNQKVMYGHVREQSPDLILFIGDIVYSNSRSSSVFQTPEDPSTALERYLLTWSTVGLYQLDPLIPTLATWDDHDYGADGGDHTHPYKAVMRNMFRSFYPMPESHERLSYGPGVSFRLTAFGIDFHMLDDRTEKVMFQTQWGGQQEKWLAKEFNASDNPAWILNGVQYFRYFVMIESVEKSAEPSLRMLRNLLKKRQKPTLLVSGDVHSSQVQELPASVFGFKTYEITSSGVHCTSAGQILKRSRAEGQLYYCGYDNFLLVRPTLQASSMELDIVCANEFGVEPVSNVPLRISV